MTKPRPKPPPDTGRCAMLYAALRVYESSGWAVAGGDTRWPFEPAPDTPFPCISGSLSSVTASSRKAIRNAI